MRFNAGNTGRVAAAGLLILIVLRAFGADAAEIQAQGGWIRWLPANLPAAGYVALVNHGSAAVELISVSSPDYADVGMHQTQDDHGVSRMRTVGSIVLKPHSTLRFEEGGYHLMLMQPTRPMHPGDKVVLVLHFGDGETIPVPFEVRGTSGGK